MMHKLARSIGLDLSGGFIGRYRTNTIPKLHPVSGTWTAHTSAKHSRQNAERECTVDGLRLPNFSDTRSVYKSKSSRELWRAYFVFSLCSVDFLVNRQLQILSWTRKLFGRSLFRRLMRWTIYGQFMAGETPNEVVSVARKLAGSGLYTMLSYTASESHGDAKGSHDLTDSQRNIFDKNKKSVKEGIDIAVSCKAIQAEFSLLVPHLATKLTYFAEAQTLFTLNEVLNQQCHLVASILNGPDSAKRKEFLDLLERVLSESSRNVSDLGMVSLTHKRGDTPHIPSLGTNLAFNLTLNSYQADILPFQHVTTPIRKLTPEDVHKLCNTWQTMDELGKYAHDNGVTLIWDAEQTYLQNAIDCLTLDNMRKYNTHRPVIHNTYQCYLKRTFDIIVRDIELGQREGFSLGFKVVRGAYIEEERRRALEMNYEDPINPDYSATTRMYEKVANHLLDSVKGSTNPAQYHVTFATHNDDTVKYVINQMIDKGTSLEDKNVSFAQLLGMRDHISLALGVSGVPAAKLIHYGDVEECVAYLSRRLTENRSGLPTAEIEKMLLKHEVRRRVLGGVTLP